MKTYRLYIGSNNTTHKLESAKIDAILSQFFTGYTMYHAKGVWRGARENTAIIEANAPKTLVMRAIARLKHDLKQEAIGYQVMPALSFA